MFGLDGGMQSNQIELGLILCWGYVKFAISAIPQLAAWRIFDLWGCEHQKMYITLSAPVVNGLNNSTRTKNN